MKNMDWADSKKSKNTSMNDLCNICGKPFLRDKRGEWINHKHKLNIYAVALGSIKSKKKAKASRLNGKKGGRPKKYLEVNKDDFKKLNYKISF